MLASKILGLAASGSALAATGALLFGEDTQTQAPSALTYENAQIQNLENRVTALEQRKSGRQVINPSGRPQVEHGYDLFLTGEFIFWKAIETGLPFAVETSDSTEFFDEGGEVPKNVVKNPHFKWRPGFRVGAGYNLPHDEWDLYLNWTWYYDKLNTNASAPSGGAIFPTWIHPSIVAAAGASYEEAKSEWRLHLDVADLELGRQFYVSKWLTLRPHGGLRSAWIDQTYNIKYEDSSTFISNYKTKMKNDFWGAGLRMGLNATWGLGGGWRIYSNGAISLIYGRFHIHHEEEMRARGGGSTDFEAKNHFSDAQALTDLALGLQWERYLDDDRFHISFGAGWEEHIYFSQNQFMHFSETFEPGLFFSNQGDLTLSGLTVSARFDF